MRGGPMKLARMLFALLLSLSATSCTAATLNLRCTAPAMDDTSSDCNAPMLVPTAGGLVRLTFSWTGPVIGSSAPVIVAPGAPVIMPPATVPPGLYHCTVVAADSLGNISCVSAVLDKLVRTKFAKVSDLK